jgi:hypothetical protein
MANDIVPAAEKLIDVKFPVLDHGFVMLDSYMGSSTSWFILECANRITRLVLGCLLADLPET